MRNFRKPHPTSSAPNIEQMDALLKRCEINLNRETLQKLWRYHNLLRNRNQDRELTRIVGFEPMVIKHYVDCLIVGKYVKLPSPLVDVGTGAGFPGIPLKLLYPNLHIILAEPRPKRITFLKEVIQDLGLKGIEVFEHKVVSRSLTQSVKGVISRAVETMDKTLLRTSAAVEKGGQVIFMKGPNADEEIEYAKTHFAAHYKLVDDIKYTLPRTPHQRRLVLWERTSDRLSIR